MKKALVMAVLGMAMGMPHALAQPDSNGMVEGRAAGSQDGMGVMPDDTNPTPAAADAPDSEAGQTAASPAPAPATREPAGGAPERAGPDQEATDRAAEQPDAGQALPSPATGETGQPSRAPKHEPEQNADARAEERARLEEEIERLRAELARTKEAETETGQPYLLWGVIAGGLLLLILLLAWALRSSLNRGRTRQQRPGRRGSPLCLRVGCRPATRSAAAAITRKTPF